MRLRIFVRGAVMAAAAAAVLGTGAMAAASDHPGPLDFAEPLHPQAAKAPAPVPDSLVPRSPAAPGDADAGDVIDLLVVYTPGARAYAGGTAAIRSAIEIAVDEANVAFADSGIATRLRLVWFAETPYADSQYPESPYDPPPSERALLRLSGTFDGHMDEVHALRDTYGADLVSLVSADLEVAGRGFQMDVVGTDFASYAFSVVHPDYLIGRYGLAHEIGHNFGAAHDYENAIGGGSYAYSFGYRIPGEVRTIMAYPCEVVGSEMVFRPSCELVPFFSSPHVFVEGEPVGVADAIDNARTINENAYTVANFRTMTVPLVNQPPVVSVQATLPVLVGNAVSTTGTFADLGAFEFTATVDFGDPDDPGPKPLTLGEGTFSLSHVYAATGSYPVEVCVADDDGAMGCATTTARVADAFDGVGGTDPESGLWYLRDAVGTSRQFYFGDPGDVPFTGDWDCDGVDTPGLYRRSDGFVYLRNSNTEGVADREFFFGNPGDVPVAGDFDGDGCDTVSIYRPDEGRFFVINELGRDQGGLGAADFDYFFGDPGDVPYVADFDGDGIDEFGLRRESTGFVYFRMDHSSGVADVAFYYGDPGDRIVAGDWIGDGVGTIGIFRPSNATFYLRATNSPGAADFELGPWPAGSLLPVTGFFGS